MQVKCVFKIIKLKTMFQGKRKWMPHLRKVKRSTPDVAATAVYAAADADGIAVDKELRELDDEDDEVPALVRSTEYDSDDSDDSDGDDEKDQDYIDDDASHYSSSDSDHSKEAEIHRIIVEQLKNECLEEHLSKELVKRTAATVKTMINRYAKLLAWFRNKSQDKDSDVNVLEMLQDIVLSRFQMLVKYYKYLTETVLLKPSTVYNFNEEVSVLLNWFAVFRDSSNDTFAVKTSDLYAANLIIKAMRKHYSKERRVLACSSSENTIEGLIAARKWPQGGLNELHNAVLGQMKWAREACADPASMRDPAVYNRFMDLMCASFYTGTVKTCVQIYNIHV